MAKKPTPENESTTSAIVDEVVLEQDAIVVSKVESKITKLNVFELIAKYRLAQARSASYEVTGDMISAKLRGAEIARIPIVDKHGDGEAILENNKKWLAPRLAEFAKFDEVDVLSQSKDGAIVSVISKDGRKYHVNVAEQTVNA